MLPQLNRGLDRIKAELMGSFIVNFHVRAPFNSKVQKAIGAVVNSGWVAATGSGWTSFWDEEASQQSEDRIDFIGERVSRSLKTRLIAFMVHDSDILCYWIYDNGRLVDHFNSCPDYWGDSEPNPKSAQADFSALAETCVARTTVRDFESIFGSRTDVREFVFEEERLAALAPLLGIEECVLLADFGSIGDEDGTEEIDAVRIGTAEENSDAAVSFKPTDRKEAFKRFGPGMQAVVAGDIEALRAFVADGHDVNAVPNGMATTLIGAAAGEVSPEFLREMIRLGANPNKGGGGGITPLWFAIQGDKLENAKVLLDAGADIHACNPQLGSLLHAAVTRMSPQLIEALLAMGVDPNQTNAAKQTPLAFAEQSLANMRQLKASVAGSDFSERLDHMVHSMVAVVELLSRR